MINPYKNIILLVIGLLFFWSCQKKHPFPDIPSITFDQYQLLRGQFGSDSLELLIGYQDGDGDLGLSQHDTVAPFNSGSKYFYNLYAEYFEKINGKFQQVTTNYPFGGDTINYHTRFPVLNKDGKKPVHGKIHYAVDLGTGPIVSDTIKFRIWIYDRALHQSNIVESPEIVIKK